MTGSIVRAHGWDAGYAQRFLAVSPLRDEVHLYQTQEGADLQKVASHGIEHIQCVACLPHPGWTAIGTLDGTVSLVNVLDSTAKQVHPKQSRPCNAVGFSTSLVAGCFDKLRLDGSLQVWDIETLQNVHSFLPNEATLSTQFHGAGLMAGGYKLIREFDLRDSSQTPTFQVATKCTLDIAVDPFQPHMFALVGDSVAVWDRRRLSEPALFFPKVGDSRPCFRYLSVRRGEFAALLGGDVVRRWNTGGTDDVFVLVVLDTKCDYPRVVSFDYSPEPLLPAAGLVCMREKGLVFRMRIVESADAVAFNLRNELAVAGPEGTYTQALEPELDDEPLSAALALNADVCAVMRRRVRRGYGVDCGANVTALAPELLGAAEQMRHTWRWLDRAKRLLDKGTMLRDGVDLGYVGVLGVWRGVGELEGQNRHSAGNLTPQLFLAAVRAIVSDKGAKTLGMTIFSGSEWRNQRKLCLIVSGWYLTAAEFDEQLAGLVEKGETEKAAGWAVFYGDVPKAVEILGLSSSERLKLMSTAVAGYLVHKDSSVNSPWNDQCRRMALELENPYLRAIFAFIADNDWWDVLDEHLLPLRERLGIAVRFLSDKDLSVYLGRVADSVVKRGDLEGLILTGLTPRGIDLLQLYVDRTSDVQLAALIAHFAVPRYFADPRVDHWVDCYRDLLNSWSMFRVRAKFDVARAKAAPGTLGRTRQVLLQCTRCNKSISAKKPQKLFGKTREGDVSACPHCGYLLPRCAICMLTMSTHVSDGGPLQRSFGDKFSFCLLCSHGYHAQHAEEWFSKHVVCPVPDCSCACNSK